MFLYINNYVIKNNNIDSELLICIVDTVIHQDYLKMISNQIYKMLNKNILIFYIKISKKDPQDLYYSFIKQNFTEQDKQFIQSLNSHPKLVLHNLLDNIYYIDKTIHFKSYEVIFNIVDDIIDNNYIIKTYNNLSVDYNTISKIKKLFA